MSGEAIYFQVFQKTENPNTLRESKYVCISLLVFAISGSEQNLLKFLAGEPPGAFDRNARPG